MAECARSSAVRFRLVQTTDNQLYNMHTYAAHNILHFLIIVLASMNAPENLKYGAAQLNFTKDRNERNA